MTNIIIMCRYFIIAALSLMVFTSFAQSEELHFESRLKKTNEFRGWLDWRLDAVGDSTKNEIKLTVVGRGRFNGFKNAHKKIESMGEKIDSGFRVLRSSTQLTDQSSNKVIEHKKEFDYVNNEVTYQRHQSIKGLTLTKVFPIKGVMCDDATMIYCVEQLLNRDENVESFYLVTNEPRMYKVMIFDRGQERINNRSVRKFQLIADLGKWTKFIIKFIPPTYVWYEEDFEHQWFQYEGMEGGRRGANIVISFVSP